MLRRPLVLTFVVGALALGGCGSSSSGSASGGNGGAATGGSGGGGGSTGGSSGATGGSSGATGGSSGATGGSGGTSGGPFKCGMPGGNGQCSAADLNAYNSCQQSKCATAYAPCVGNFATSGQVGGRCATYFNCANACACTDSQCLLGCFSMSSTNDCLSCLITADQTCSTLCTKPACLQTPDGGAPPFDGGFSFGDGGFNLGDLNISLPDASATACADLMRCCDALPATSPMKQTCSQVAGSGIAFACAAAQISYCTK